MHGVQSSYDGVIRNTTRPDTVVYPVLADLMDGKQYLIVSNNGVIGLDEM